MTYGDGPTFTPEQTKRLDNLRAYLAELEILLKNPECDSAHVAFEIKEAKHRIAMLEADKLKAKYKLTSND